jgi:hypothetical protein
MTDEAVSAVNARKLMKRVRKEVLGKNEPDAQLQEMAASIAEARDSIYTAHLYTTINIAEPIQSHRRFLGPFLVFFRRVFRKLARFHVASIAAQQEAFNHSIVSALQCVMDVTHTRLDMLEERLCELEESER